MKKTLIFLLIFTIRVITLKTQTWIDQGAKWTFDYELLIEYGTFVFEYIQDTTIHGVNAQVISITNHRFFPDQFGNINLITSYEDDRYTYQSGDSVFYFKDSTFYLLYDFGASIGDQWIIGIDDTSLTSFNCSDTVKVQVVDTGFIVINGQNLRTITLNTISNTLTALSGLAIEKFGLLPINEFNYNYGFFPGIKNCDSSVFIDYNTITFRCYEDNSFTTFNPTNYTCDYLTSAHQLQPKSSSIFPNPVIDYLFINENNFIEVVIRDVQGKIIISHPLNGKNHIIDFSNIKAGIYFSEWKTKTGVIEIKKIIKN